MQQPSVELDSHRGYPFVLQSADIRRVVEFDLKLPHPGPVLVNLGRR